MSIPKRVYHYTSKKTALEHILPAKKIRISSLANTNDPRETKEWGFPVFFSGNIDFGILNQLQETANHIRCNEWWVLCTCQNDPNLVEPKPNQPDLTHFKYGYARARMWAQYADNHKGVCLELDGPALHDAILKTAASNPLYYGSIKYADEWDIPNLRTRGEAFQFNYDSLAKVGLEEGIRGHIRQHHEHFMLEKSLDWETESEFRWLVNSASGPFYVDISKALLSVIVGVDFPSEDGHLIRHLCDEHGAKVEKMNWNNRVPSKSTWGN